MLCTEGLSHLLNRSDREGKLTWMQLSESGPSIHHLLFADDNLLICKADQAECYELKQILDIYEGATGQPVNLDKSSISFGENVDDQVKSSIQSAIGIFKEGGTGSYLGLLECFSGSKVDMLGYIKDRLKARMSG